MRQTHALASGLLILTAASAGGLHRQPGGTPPPDPAIAYVDEGIRVMNADGSNPRTLVPLRRGEAVRYPTWSHDDAHIVFWGLLSNVAGIYRVPVAGGSPTLITTTVNTNPTYARPPRWSPVPAPDGQYKIGFADRSPVSGQYELLLVNPDGTGLAQLTDTPGVPEVDPAWSPDARSIVAVRRIHDLVIFDIDLVEGSIAIVDEHFISSVGPQNPVFANNSPWLAFGMIEPSGYMGIAVLDLTSPAPPVVITPVGFPSEARPCFSPDDSRIVFSRAPNPNAGIHTIRSDGSGEIRLSRKGNDPSWRHRP